MDAVSYAHSAKQAQRIEKFIENPDSTSGIVTVPKTIASGETVTVPAGRVAVLPNIVVDGTLNIDGEVFIPSGSSVDFSNGIKIDGNNIALSIPTAYHLLQGNLSVSNEVITNGFSTTLYTGNGGAQSINTGVDMATQWGNDVSETYGGLVWGKARSNILNNNFFDTVRGPTKMVCSDLTNAEGVDATRLTSFNSTGFSLGSGANLNTSAATYASWNFQTTHRRTGVTNHGKAYTEHYNPFTGFTIIKYEGSGIVGHEIPHSLGRPLEIIIQKDLNAASQWLVSTKFSTDLGINTTASQDGVTRFISTADKVVNSIGTGTANVNGNQTIVYGWANSYLDESNKLIGNYEIGVYQGTGVAGNKVTTRGKPAWVIVKRLDSTGNWIITDNQRNTETQQLAANSPGVENDYLYDIVYNINGFTLPNTNIEVNASGGQYLYMVVYDNDSGSGKSKYPRATDTSNVQINNAIIPLAHGIDSNGSKNSIVIANETIIGLTYIQGKNYLYKTDTGYGVKPYEPRMLSSELVRRFAGEQPDYYDGDKNKWFNTDAGSELVSNGKFISNITGWTQGTSSTASYNSGVMRLTSVNVNNDGVYQNISTVVGMKYTIEFSVAFGTRDTITVEIDNNRIAAIATVSGVKYLTFVANNTTTKLEFDTATSATGQYLDIDYVSVYPTDIVPTTEITESRNYLNHIVHADQNGQVTYVEELPKIEYKDIIKANEYRGKNACTAWCHYDLSTTPPTLKEGYNIGTIIRSATGRAELYFNKEMDTDTYTTLTDIKALSGIGDQANVGTQYKNKVIINSTAFDNSALNATSIYIAIFGGKN